VNRFGKGTAIYLATESKASVIGPVLEHFYASLGIELGPRTPAGVYARVVDGRTLYVNTSTQDQSISIEGSTQGIITHRDYNGFVNLKPEEADLIPATHLATH
jgi:beta-galactosidase